MMEDKADDSLHWAAPGITRQGMNQAFIHGPILLSGEGQGDGVAGLDEWKRVLEQVQLAVGRSGTAGHPAGERGDHRARYLSTRQGEVGSRRQRQSCPSAWRPGTCVGRRARSSR